MNTYHDRDNFNCERTAVQYGQMLVNIRWTPHGYQYWTNARSRHGWLPSVHSGVMIMDDFGDLVSKENQATAQ